MRRVDRVLRWAFLVAAGRRVRNKEPFVQVRSPAGQPVDQHSGKELGKLRERKGAEVSVLHVSTERQSYCQKGGEGSKFGGVLNLWGPWFLHQADVIMALHGPIRVPAPLLSS